MLKLVRFVLSVVARCLRDRVVVELENRALRHQLHVLRRQRPGRPRLFAIDRWLWVWLFREVVTAPRSPWQNAYVERVIGSIRRECLDHLVIFNARHLRRILLGYVDYYHRTRTHLALDKDCPDPRPVMPRRIGKVVAIPQVRGLHHRYERLAA
jgi:transposase InsO family protein